MTELPADIRECIVRWREHPSTMVRELFGVVPDEWQHDALEAFPHSNRLAMKAAAGPGKTAVLSWIGWNFLLTRPHSMIGCTSISGANLKAGLWTEFARWMDRSKGGLLKVLFEQTKTEIFAKEAPMTWRIEARTWAQDANADQIGNALAGLHADHIMWLLDETGEYPDAILPICEGIFNGEPKEAHIVQAGNPTSTQGPLYRACQIARSLWKVIEITADPDDPKRTPRVSVEIARQQIQQYGRDDPWVRTRILGLFPKSNINALIGPDEIRDAMARRYRPEDVGNSPLVFGVDVARYGDDQSVIYPRKGIVAFNPVRLRNVDSLQGAGRVSRMWEDHKSDAVFVDNTGGFGSGWIDQLRQLGRSPIGVGFATKPHNVGRYANKRAEMYFDLIAWIKEGGALPPDALPLVEELPAMTYTFHKDTLILEPKDLIKVKIGHSPDDSDALALTFAEPVVGKDTSRRPTRPQRVQTDWNPFAEQTSPVVSSETYDPYKW